MKRFLFFALLVPAFANADAPNNFVVNAHFDEDATQWYQDPHAIAFWDTPDADYSPVSGSAWIVDDEFAASNNFRSVLEQCVFVGHDGTYFVGATGYVPTMQTKGDLVLRYLYIYGNVCSLDAGAVGYLTVPRTDSWQKLGLSTPLLHTPGWIRISLGTERSVDGTEFTGHFDDIIVSDDELFPSNFE